MPAGKERDESLASVVEDAMETDPEFAKEAFKQWGAFSKGKGRLIQHFAMRLAEQDPEGALQWAQSLETDEERSLAFGNIALVMSAEDPEAAAKLLSDSGVAGREFDVAVVQVIQRWAAVSPADAAAWVVRFDPGEARTAGIKAVVSSWVESAPKAVHSWIAGLQDPTLRDEACAGMAQTIIDLPDRRQQEIVQLTTPDIRLRVEKLKAEADGGE